MAYYTNRHGELASTYGLVGDDSDTGKDMQREKIEADKENERIRADASRFGATTSANAQIEAAKIRAGAGYAKGGPVVHVGYKHNNDPMYAKYSASMDSSLLAKNRKRT